MHTVKTRVYGVDKEGRKVLLHRPGDILTDDDAKRAESLGAPAVETPAKALGSMKLDELRTICEVEGIDPGDANTRAEFRKKIEAGREKRRSESTNER